MVSSTLTVNEAVAEWRQWREAIWNLMEKHLGYPGLGPLEQYMLRSKREKRCIDCGKPGTMYQQSVLIKCVDHYWMCDDCDAYWRQKA